jgi:hypothetical protein
VKIFVVVLQIHYLSAFPGGASIASCISLAPSHGQNIPQATEAPFLITTSTNLINQAQRLTLKIEGIGVTFRGFIIQARNNADASQVVGRFISGLEIGLINCANTPAQSTATHTSSDEKSTLLIEWEAPRDFTGVVNFQ